MGGKQKLSPRAAEGAIKFDTDNTVIVIVNAAIRQQRFYYWRAFKAHILGCQVAEQRLPADGGRA